jgi:lipoate-protein ligase A
MAETWHLLESGLGEAAWNMALDDALLRLASRESQPKPVLRFYGWIEPAATFGYSQKHAWVERATPLRPLIRRPTGGGVVPHDRDWTYSVVIPPCHWWYNLKARESYRQVHVWVREGLVTLGVVAELAAMASVAPPGECFARFEQSDVLRQGRKIAGAAQRRTRSGLLIQGSVQPPCGELSRASWQQAMLRAGQKLWGIEWVPLGVEEDTGLHKLARALTQNTYSQPCYSMRR